MALDIVGDVAQFHETFGMMVSRYPGHLARRKLRERVECMLEELNEFAESCGLRIVARIDDVSGVNDLAGQADALVDLVYFAAGTSVMLGLPFDELWRDVHRANMMKVRGVSHRGHKVDVVKPAGWIGPQTRQILVDAGYVRDEWVDLFKNIDEERCRDDER